MSLVNHSFCVCDNNQLINWKFNCWRWCRRRLHQNTVLFSIWMRQFHNRWPWLKRIFVLINFEFNLCLPNQLIPMVNRTLFFSMQSQTYIKFADIKLLWDFSIRIYMIFFTVLYIFNIIHLNSLINWRHDFVRHLLVY